jgi:quinol monooxygenase YgiN
MQKGDNSMHARVTTVQAQPGKLEEVIRIVRESVLPAAKQQKGWKSLTLLADANAGKVVTVGYWETEADLVASETSGYFREQIEKVVSLLVGPPVREIYEVRFQE